jgi:predicted Zn-dependent protease
VTRPLMSLMDDESELAIAVGHEAAHVAANHAHIREQYARRSQYGVLGSILGSVFGDGFFGGMLQQRAKNDALSFSREQECQADSLALRYLIGAGYDPVGGSEMLAALSRNTALQARMQGRSNRQTPEWAQTHPLSENRMQRMLIEARATGRLGRGLRNHDGFLAQLRGMYVDDDPAQGVIDGPTFTHPDLRIQFTVPQGYLMSNATDSVTVSGSAGKAQFRGGQFAGQIDQAVLLAFRSLTRGQSNFPVPQPQHVTINGMPAAVTTARANGSSGPVDVSVAAYQWGPQQVYYFVMLTPAGSGVGPFVPMINSLRRISSAEAASIRPRVIDVVTVAPGDTVQSLSNRMAYRDFKAERFMSLNGLQPNSRLLPGQKVKLVVYGPRRA